MINIANVLLVEDTPAHIKLTRRALEQSKIVANLHVAINGEEALQFLYNKEPFKDAPRPDLVLLDLNLPKIGGKEVLSILKSDDTLKTIPIIILTTSTALLDIDETYKSHANAYITKPVSFESLVEALSAINQFWFVLATQPPK